MYFKLNKHIYTGNLHLVRLLKALGPEAGLQGDSQALSMPSACFRMAYIG